MGTDNEKRGYTLATGAPKEPDSRPRKPSLEWLEQALVKAKIAKGIIDSEFPEAGEARNRIGEAILLVEVACKEMEEEAACIKEMEEKALSIVRGARLLVKDDTTR